MCLYECNYRVLISDIDNREKLRLSSLLNYFQDVATLDSEVSGGSVALLRSRNIAWFVSDMETELYEELFFNDVLTVCTWANDYKGVICKRHYQALKNGKVVANSYANWFMVDLLTRKPIKTPEDIKNMYSFNENNILPTNKKKIQIPFGEPILQKRFPVFLRDTDRNSHMNNTVYVAIAADCLFEINSDYVLRNFRIQYKKEIKAGDLFEAKVFEISETEFVIVFENAGEISVLIEMKI
ncbi:MAG: thioesterase [Bacillota bacterium]|nr:thioesterase [Bacillota bacterium]